MESAKEIAGFISVLWSRNDAVTALPRICVGIVWSCVFLFLPFFGARIGGWFFAAGVTVAALWWCGVRREKWRYWVWLLPAGAFWYLFRGRPDVAAGWAVALFAVASGAGIWKSSKKREYSGRIAAVLSWGCALVFIWKSPDGNYSDLAPIYSLYLFSVSLWSVTKVKR